MLPKILAPRDDNVIFKRRMTLIALLAGAAQSSVLVNSTIVAYNGRFAYYHARAVVDKQVFAYLRARVNLDARTATYDLRNASGDKLEFYSVKNLATLCQITA